MIDDAEDKAKTDCPRMDCFPGIAAVEKQDSAAVVAAAVDDAAAAPLRRRVDERR